MNAWLRQHARAAAQGARRLGALNALVIGIALALPAGAYALLDSLQALTARASLAPQISVFLPAEAKRAEADALGARLRSDARVARVRFVPREQALKELGGVQGVAELVGALGRNPLPDAFVVDAAEGSLEPLAADLARLPGVAHVQADAIWARRLAGLARLGRIALWLLAGLLGAALVAVTFNTIRLQILTQRDEIEVSKLIGATDPFIRRPFLYYGVLQGVAGGAAAWLIVWVGVALLNGALTELGQLNSARLELRHLGLDDSLSLLAFSGVLGGAGSWLSVNQHLAGIGPQ